MHGAGEEVDGLPYVAGTNFCCCLFTCCIYPQFVKSLKKQRGIKLFARNSRALYNFPPILLKKPKKKKKKEVQEVLC